MVSYKKPFLFLIASMLVCTVLIVSIFIQIRQSAIREMNERQRIYARLAATGIEAVLNNHITVLEALARSRRIIALNEDGKALLRETLKGTAKYVRNIGRTDSLGRILYVFPYAPQATGAKIAQRPYIQKILKNKQTVISNIFESPQGFSAVAIHVPIFRGKTFEGTLGFLISFSDFAKGYLSSLYIPNARYALLLNADGKIMYCFQTEHIGRSPLELLQDNLSVSAMIEDMRNGKEGEATFNDKLLTGNDTESQRVQVVYAPIRAGNTFWSVALVSSERLILPWAQNITIQVVILALILLIFFALAIYVAARMRIASVEAQKRRDMEKDLLKSAREISDLYHNAPCGYHSLDAEGRIVRINDMELDWLGYSRNEILGKPYTDILTDSGREQFYAAFDRLKQEGIVHDLEYEMQRKDGSTFPVLITASSIFNKKGEFFMTRSMVMDMTLRRVQEQRLRESEALYRTALETTSDGITIVDTVTGVYLYVNQKFMNTIGRPEESLVGQTMGSYIHPDDRELGRASYRERKESRRPDSFYEIRLFKPDGAVALFSVKAVDVTYGGKPAVLSFMTDITESKRTEDALRESEALYRTALETTSDGVTIVQDGIYVYVNQKFLNTLGVAREDIVNRRLGVLAGPEAQKGLREFLSRHPQTIPLPDIQITRVPKPDGAFIYLQSSSVDIIFQGKPAILTFIRDITESKKAEQALRESEALYRTALESTSDGITITDVKDGKYLYVNQKMTTTLGMPNENLIGCRMDLLVHPDDIGLGRNSYLERKRTGKSASFYESRIVKKDGSGAIVSVTATDIIFQGRTAVISFVQDITEKKRQEEALKESEELYRRALENTSDGISIVQENKYVYVNSKFLDTIGRKEAEILHMPLGIFIHADDAGKVKKYFIDRVQGKKAAANYDIRVLKPDGSYITLNIRAIRIDYQGKPATLSFMIDVTERRNAEEALRRSEERYRTIIENIDDDYFETDLTGTVLFFNRPFACSGISREELIGTNHQRYMNPDSIDRIVDLFKQVYLTGKPIRILDYEVLRRDGSICHQEMSISLMRDANGRPIGFRGISRDVTERIKMEEERKRLTEQLYQAQKMEAIGTLAGGIAHDFNNLLMGIQGYTSLMLLEDGPSHPHYEQLRSVQTLVQSGANLTRQLLGFARAGRYEVVSTQLNDLIGKSLGLFGRTRKEISLFENYAENLWSSEVDRGQIEQVLLNLFVNAWQAMPGGGSLYVTTENIHMQEPLAKIHDLAPGHYVKISITDTGVGMDEKTRQRIFDPFFTTKEMGRGTGLGLASAYGIIKGHAGMITVYSEKGHGTTFNLYLPASSKAVDTEEPAEGELSGGRETILLVDDETVITDVTSRLLAELGYRIITASSGREAVDIYKEQSANIHLVILDMIMPGMSGSETYDLLKAVNPSARVILSSGYSLNDKAKGIMEKGVRIFLQKPYRLNDLAQKIREALS